MKLMLAIGAGLAGIAGVAAVLLTRNRQAGDNAPAVGGVAALPEPVAPIGIFKNISEGVVSLMNEPKGIRNNNPLNIEWNSLNNWVGQLGSDGRFSVFDKAENGIRAGGRNIDSYARRGVVTIAQIIATWAPPEKEGKIENDTEAYIRSIEKQTGWNRGRVISRAAGDYVPLIAAMIKHENGKNPYSNDFIRGALSLP